MRLPPIAATTVGSFPRPAWLLPLQTTTEPFLHEAQDDATIVALQVQAEAGLDLVSDGEQRRVDGFINYVLGALDGFDLEHRRGKRIRRNRSNDERPVPTVVGKIQRRGPIVVNDLLFAKAHTSLPVKMTVPGPLSAVDSTFDLTYGDEAALAMDIAAALNEEILALQAAGCDIVQIDEPAMTRYHDKTATYGAHALDRCLEGVTIPTIVHLCYGYPGRAPILQHEYEYPELLELLMETRVGGFTLEFARSGYDPAILRGVGDRLVLYGCVDPGDAPAEPLETVVARVRAALQYVAPEQLLIGPDCGLMTISRDLARQKAELLASAAREVRRTL